jgi:hypothetical protein
MKHDERIELLTTIHAQLCEMRDAYCEPTATLARRACDAVKALQQAMRITHKERPRRRAATDGERRRALHARLLKVVAEREKNGEGRSGHAE